MPPLNFHSDIEDIVEDIRKMRVRGAGRIARKGVKALQIASKCSDACDSSDFVQELNNVCKHLCETRPTAVSLPNGLKYVMRRLEDARKNVDDVSELKKILDKISLDFVEESKKAVQKIGIIGAKRIMDGDTLLTHCNSESAIEIIKQASKNRNIHTVYVTETRPRFQGRETAQILSDLGISTILIIDSAARFFMNKIDKVIVGADAVASNGAVVNKIGTSMLALTAKESRTQFYVACETYKFSSETAFGELIKIEERDSSEVIPSEFLKGKDLLKVRNPAFDVTPGEYIDLIITEKGIIPPQAVISLIQQEFGWSLIEEPRDVYAFEED